MNETKLPAGRRRARPPRGSRSAAAGSLLGLVLGLLAFDAADSPPSQPEDAGRPGHQEVRERRASSRPFSFSSGPLMPVRSFSAIRQAK